MREKEVTIRMRINNKRAENLQASSQYKVRLTKIELLY